MADTDPLVIIGSARSDGDTRQLVDKLLEAVPFEILDLRDYIIHPYNYTEQYPDDDAFMIAIVRMLKHDRLVFATPVYWYAMSGPMKIFFDRFSDLVTTRKPVGRQLAGKHLYLVAVGASHALPEGFEVPFRETANYLSMKFEHAYYCRTADVRGPLHNAAEFVSSINSNSIID